MYYGKESKRSCRWSYWKSNKAAKETAAENGESVKKETDEAKVATKSFLKEVGEMFVSIFKAIGKFFQKAY